MNLKQISEVKLHLEELLNLCYDITEALMEGNNTGLNEMEISYSTIVINLDAAILKTLPKFTIDVLKKRRLYAELAKLDEIIIKTSGLTHEQRSVRTRKREIVLARQVHMALLQKVFGYSDYNAGLEYNLDRATAIHACKTVKNLYQTNKTFREDYAPVFKHCLSLKDYGFNLKTYLQDEMEWLKN